MITVDLNIIVCCLIVSSNHPSKEVIALLEDYIVETSVYKALFRCIIFVEINPTDRGLLRRC